MNEPLGRLESLFTAALQLPPADRAPYLDQACADEPPLRQRVEALLRAQAAAGGFLQAPCVTVDDAPATEHPGTVIGRYKILEKIGEGGMGTVWMAQQQEPVKRLVALKLIKAGMDSKQILARFEAERQALALMEHANIARVLDAGTTSAGRPYFVMDLVKGVPINRYCDEHRLTLRQRLELFLPVCAAVQHAHQKGVIHRDLKPSNVLVALYDGKAVPKVIDFGVAKAAGQSLTDRTLVTGFGAIVGTLEYMSPEQAELNQRDVDTRSDVYSLGVLLYELLTGSTPFPRERFMQATYDEIRRIIHEEEPTRPSNWLSEARDTLPAISAQRQTEPAKLAKLVRGELDWIVMKALEKDRSRRYETANDLAMDVQRYLHDEPVLTGPPSAGYRLRKFARRHRGAFTAAALTAAALLVGIAVSTWQAIRATRAERLAEQRLEAEQQESARAGTAERQARQRQFEALVAQARASRRSRQFGQRWQSWAALTEAAALARALGLGEERLRELRDEAIACLALTDVRPGQPWRGWPPGTSAGLGFDADLERYARSDLKGLVRVRRVADDRELARLPGDGGGASRMLFSPDGRFLAVGYWGGAPGRPTTVRLWDWQQARAVPTPAGAIHAMGFSPDGRLLALGHADGTLTIRATATGDEVRRQSLEMSPLDLAFAPDGSKLAVASSAGEVRVYEASADHLLLKFSPGRVRQVAWHPEGTLLATAGEDAQVRLWEAATGQQRAVFRGHDTTVVRVAFAPGGETLLSSSDDGTSRLWDVRTGRELVRFPGEARQFSRDGRRLVSQAGCHLRLCEVVTAREYRTLAGNQAANTEHIRGGGISPDGRWLVVAQGGSYRLWDLPSGTVTALAADSHAEDARFHPSGSELFTSGRAGLYRWPAQAGPGVVRIGPAHRLPVGGSTGTIALDREGRTLTAGRNRGAWVLDTQKPTGSLACVEHVNAQKVATSPDGGWFATGTQNGFGVKVWQTQGGQLLRHLIPDERVASVAFSPDGRWLVTGTGSEFGIWETASWRLARSIPKEHAGGLPGRIAFAPDGTTLAVDVATGVVLLLDPVSGRPLARLEVPETSPLSWITFSPDGGQLVACAEAGRIAVWDLRQLRARLQEIGLDWALPPCPPSRPGDSKPVKVEVDPGGFERGVQAQKHFACGQRHAQAGRWRDAVSAAMKALEFVPEYACAWHLRGRAHGRLGEWDRAAADLSKAAELAPGDPLVLNNQAWMLGTCPEPRHRDPARALALAERAVRQAPDNAAYWNTLGVARYRAGHWQGAVKALRTSADLAGTADGFDAFFLAMAHRRLGDEGQARSSYASAVEWMTRHRPGDEELRRLRAEAAELLGFQVEKD